MGHTRAFSLSHSSLSILRSDDQTGDFLTLTTEHNPVTSRTELIIATKNVAPDDDEEETLQEITLNPDEIKELLQYLQSSDHENIMDWDGQEMDGEFYEL